MLSKIVLSLFAISYASAAANPLPNAEGLPEGFALAYANPDDATYECHASCGYAILAARNCSSTGEDGSYDASCLCASDSQFISLVPSCLDCGWCLWSDYGTFLTAALAECSTSTEPTGTACATAATTAAESSAAAAETTAAETSAAAETTAALEAASTEAAAAETTALEASSTEAAAAPTSEAEAEAAASSEAAPVAAESSSAVASAATSSIQEFTGAANKIAIGAGSVLVGLAAFLI